MKNLEKLERFLGPAYFCPMCKRIKVGKRIYRLGDTEYETIKKQYEHYMFDELCPREKIK